MKKLIIITLSCLIATAALSASVNAATKENFKPGRIIDDYVFYNSGAMSAEQIQTFLTSKVPSCDYDGTQPASDWGYPNITHAQLAEYKRTGSNGFQLDTGFHAPPYKCLRVYTQDTPQMEAASGLCEGLPSYTNRTAAQIIKDVASACGINPQVLIVLLEKEQSLVTDNWPLNRQLDKATGFACPDTAPCNPAYSGFFYQVYYAARQFKVYRAYPNNYNYIAGRTQLIRWSPDSGCGSGQVYIENQATAGLYIYTPYQPNAAALNNLYGSGDSCSAYGNRNFWRIFTDWFGTTYSGQERQTLVSKGSNTLAKGSQLASREFLTSADGRYVLVMQPSGQLVMYKSKQIIWQTSSVNWSNAGASLSFASDGNVKLSLNNSTLWETATSGSEASKLVLQNDGNLVLYTASNQVIWASNTPQAYPAMQYVGTSLSTTQRLNFNSYLRSTDWRYFLVMQSDGNLVLYTAGFTQPIWESKTYGRGGKYVSLQNDGNLVMYGDNGPVWASGTDGKYQVSSLNLQPDGNLVLYNSNNQVLWASGTDGKGGKYVSLQTDGNLVMYGDNGAVWASGTDGKGGKYVSLQTDGNLVMYGDNGAVWASGTDGASRTLAPFTCTVSNRIILNNRINTGESLCSNGGHHRLILQGDGNLVLYARKTMAKWASGTDGLFFKSDLSI